MSATIKLRSPEKNQNNGNNRVRSSANDVAIRICCSNCSNIIDETLANAGKPTKCGSCGEFQIVPKERFGASVVLGDFIIQEKLGQGGAGTVYLAHQGSLDRLCAVKIMHDNTLGHKDKLIKEARLAAKLNHPNLVQCYAITATEDLCYYAMEYVKGRTLTEILNKSWKLSPAKSLEIVTQVAEGLNYAWREQRLIHQDIKNDNIMINEDDEIKLADFGLARLVHESREDGDFINCTPEFAFPEEIKGEEVDFRGDIYSLGVVFYSCVTGNLPFKGEHPSDILSKHLNETPATPQFYTPDLADEFSEVILQMLEKKPENRFADYEVLLKTLRQLKILSQTQELANTGVFPMNTTDSMRSDSTIFTQANAPTTRLPQQNQQEHKSHTKLFAVLTAVILLLGIIVTGLALYKFNPEFAAMVNNVTNNATSPSGAEANNSNETANNPDKTEKSKQTTPTPLANPLPIVKQPSEGDLMVKEIMVDPLGFDSGKEYVVLSNTQMQKPDLTGLILQDEKGDKHILDKITLQGKEEVRIDLPSALVLNDRGDTVAVLTETGQLICQLAYKAEQVVEGKPIVNDHQN